MTGRHALEDDLGFLLARASALLVKSSNEALAPLGLKVRGYSVLSIACDDRAGVTQRQVAEDVGLDPSQIVALVDDLEKHGLVQRTTDPNDRRNKIIVATDAGRALCAQAQRCSREVVAQHFATVNPKTLDELRAILGHAIFPEVDVAAS